MYPTVWSLTLLASLLTISWNCHSEWENRFTRSFQTQPVHRQSLLCGEERGHRTANSRSTSWATICCHGVGDSTLVPPVRSFLGPRTAICLDSCSVPAQNTRSSLLLLTPAHIHLQGRFLDTMPGTFPLMQTLVITQILMAEEKPVFYCSLNDRNIV